MIDTQMKTEGILTTFGGRIGSARKIAVNEEGASMNKAIILILAALMAGCAYNETTNHYTINGNDNRIESVQESSTSRPVEVDLAGSGYGSVAK